MKKKIITITTMIIILTVVSFSMIYTIGAQGAEDVRPVCKATSLINGQIKFEITQTSQQEYVEIFIEHNGIQITAQNITTSEIMNYDGTSTYSFIQSGFKSNDGVEYRFYSHLRQAGAVFTPGEEENVWASASYDANSRIAIIPTFKDASVIMNSYGYGSVPERNFGELPSVDVGNYYHTSNALFGFDLSNVLSTNGIEKCELIFPSYTSTNVRIKCIFDLNKVTDSKSWTESSVTYKNQPEAPLYQSFSIPEMGKATIDVKDLITQAISNNEEEISFKLTPTAGNIFFASKESGKPAYLYLELK